MSLALVVLLPFLGAILPLLMSRSGRTAATVSAAVASGLSLALLLTHTAAVFRGEVLLMTWSWIPSAGLDFSLMIDGLGFLFASMILSIGMLVIIYARFYLSREDGLGRFLAYLLCFQGAMLGVVLSNNILLMIVFWELTSLSSFLLIGFKSQYAAGRQGARMALIVTAFGGLSLLAGFLLLGTITGSYNLSEILPQREQVQNSPYYIWVLGLILVGCFTKSAQFPFHFWLPHAMAAPTPVSAYLHSATMVKAGIFLMARTWPVLAGNDIWFYLVTTVGVCTLLLGAAVSLFRDDLKSILAYSTISHLGMMTMLLGLNQPMAVVACMFHIINHASFKAALFMNAGIIDHEAGTRNLGQLGGLYRFMPIVATLSAIATLSMAGIPPLNGFLSKEMMLEEISHLSWFGSTWLLSVLGTFAALLSVAYSFRFFSAIFLGRPQRVWSGNVHDPERGMWFSPALLVGVMLWISWSPESWAGPLTSVAAGSALQGDAPQFQIALWHGLTPAFYMSVIAIVFGTCLYFGAKPLRRYWDRLVRVDAKELFEASLHQGLKLGSSLMGSLHNGSLQRMVFVLILLASSLGCLAFAGSTYSANSRSLLPVNSISALVWFLVIASTFLVVMQIHNRLFALLVLNVIGLVSAIAYVYLSAPDLALTQIAVEVVTLILMLLALYFFPKHSIAESSRWKRYRDGGLSVVVGTLVGSLCWAMLGRSSPKISDYFVERSVPDGGGANVVNVILVDFRGFDTFGEICVIGISALAIHAMLTTMFTGPLAGTLAQWSSELRKSPQRHPMIMVVVTRLMLPLAIMVAVFLFMRGHQLPGGGFVGALVISIAIIMQYMASGFSWAERQIRFDYHVLIGFGGLIAAFTGIGAMVLDLPFLTSGYTHVHLPIIGDVELASAAAFDFGVLLMVTGGVMLALVNFSNLGRMTSPRSKLNDQPMDSPLASASELDSTEGKVTSTFDVE